MREFDRSGDIGALGFSDGTVAILTPKTCSDPQPTRRKYSLAADFIEIAGGHVYLASRSGHIIMIDPDTLRARQFWRFSTVTGLSSVNDDLAILTDREIVLMPDSSGPKTRSPLPFLDGTPHGDYLWPHGPSAIHTERTGMYLMFDFGEFGGRVVYQPLPFGEPGFVSTCDAVVGYARSDQGLLMYGGIHHGIGTAMVQHLPLRPFAGNQPPPSSASCIYSADSGSESATDSKGPQFAITDMLPVKNGFLVRSYPAHSEHSESYPAYYVDQTFSSWQPAADIRNEVDWTQAVSALLCSHD